MSAAECLVYNPAKASFRLDRRIDGEPQVWTPPAARLRNMERRSSAPSPDHPLFRRPSSDGVCRLAGGTGGFVPKRSHGALLRFCFDCGLHEDEH